MVIRKVGIWSVARMYGALSGGMGLIFGLIIAVLSAVGMTLAEGDEPPFIAAAMGVGAVVILPIFYGVLGICAGAIGAALYNVLAGIVGGVTIEVD
jgi:uncharacterized protein YacL